MKHYTDFAKELALEAGRLIKENFSPSMSKKWKSDGTPLTVTDTKINSLVIESVKKTYSTHGVLGEEESFNETSEYVWVCDPIDGTNPFFHGIPTSVFSLALCKSGIPIVGVIYDPYLDRLVIGEKGKGAYLNSNKATVSQSVELSKTLIDFESYISPNHIRNLSTVRDAIMQQGGFPLSLTSSVYAGMLVAIGEIAAVVCTGHTPWDGAAVKIIVEEASGIVTDIYGNDQRYDKDIKGFVASNKVVHKRLLSLISQHI